MAKKIKATHRLRKPHNVHYDPDRHFGVEGANKDDRITLPAGTHVIPTDLELQNIPDRLEPLGGPEPAAEREAEGNADEGNAAHAAVDAALAEVNGSWDALTKEQLEKLAAGYEIKEDAIEGSGSGGNVVKADWLAAVQAAREA